MRVIPTLSVKGHVSSVEERIDRILLYYQTLNSSMTNRFRGKIRSLQYAIWQAGTGRDNMSELTRIVKSDLEMIVGNNFPDGCSIEVSIRAVSPTDERQVLYIGATVEEDGRTYDFSKALDSIDSSYMKTLNVNREM